MKDLINNLANKAGDQGDFVVWLLEQKLAGRKVAHPNLTDGQLDFLHKHGIKATYKLDLGEWEIEL